MKDLIESTAKQINNVLRHIDKKKCLTLSKCLMNAKSLDICNVMINLQIIYDCSQNESQEIMNIVARERIAQCSATV